VFIGWFAYHERNHSQRQAVRDFFAALQSKNYEQAYSIWQRDPDWKQHPQSFQTIRTAISTQIGGRAGNGV